MPHIRPYRPTDRARLAEICVRTGARGNDATGVYSDDLLLGEVYVLPYVEFAPDLAFVVASDDDEALGYSVGVADTDAFIEWYEREWAPGFRERHPLPGRDAAETRLLIDGATPERMRLAELERYPAHLHIDLLPDLQGLGFGRRLIETLLAALGEQGAGAVHLVMDPANTNARAFYDRLGFVELASSTGSATVLGIATR